jgi:mRNA-degrading endonuclease RelE of RelBE toxin-antitoxin system
MDKVEKYLRKKSLPERQKILFVLEKILAREFDDLQVLKLKGRQDVYRVRKGNMRIIFEVRDGKVFLLKIEDRNDTTYNF